MHSNVINSYGEARFFSARIIPFVVSAILLFMLLQIVQSAGLSESQIGAEEEQFGNNDVPSGFGEEDLYVLEVNVILREEIEPYLQPINAQLVEIFWDMKDIETQEMPRGRPDRIISLYSLRIFCLVTYACTSSIMTTQLPVLNANLQNFLKFSSDKL